MLSGIAASPIGVDMFLGKREWEREGDEREEIWKEPVY